MNSFISYLERLNDTKEFIKNKKADKMSVLTICPLWWKRAYENRTKRINKIKFLGTLTILRNEYQQLFFMKKTIEKREIDIDLVQRPRKVDLLPNVLSKQEVKTIL